MKKKLSRQEIIDNYLFFEKQNKINEIVKILPLLIIGVIFFYLAKLPNKDYLPIITFYRSFFFRYSIFGNIFISISLFKLYKTAQKNFHKSILLLGLIIYFFHGISSFFDYSGIFMTNIFLELLASFFPLIIIFYYLYYYHPKINVFLSIISTSLFILQNILFCIVYFFGFIFIFSKIPLVKFYSWYTIKLFGLNLRFIHFSLGISIIISLILILFNIKKYVPGFTEMEKFVYLDK